MPSKACTTTTPFPASSSCCRAMWERPVSNDKLVVQVKFHPTDSNLLASGSLDSTVRIWDLAQGACVCSYNFGESSHCFAKDLGDTRGSRSSLYAPDRAKIKAEQAECQQAAESKNVIRCVRFICTNGSLSLRPVSNYELINLHCILMLYLSIWYLLR